MKKPDYNDQIFINCPFDKKYSVMFRACVFTVLDAGFIPRCSLEIENGTQSRLGAIYELISDCRYGIHDLSRVQLDSGVRLPRFNMPFELGLFYSAKYFGTNNHKNKKCLILEKEKYRYQTFISDLAGIDITPHDNKPEILIKELRNWLVTASRRTVIPHDTQIIKHFHAFQPYIKKTCKINAIDYYTMPFVEIVHNMTQWLKLN